LGRSKVDAPEVGNLLSCIHMNAKSRPLSPVQPEM
jgi:hypothetical protein